MKVCFLTDLYPSQDKPFYCIYIEQLAQAAQIIGLDVSVIIPADSEKCEFVQNGVKVVKLNKLNIKNELYEYVHSNNIDLIDVHFIPLKIYKIANQICKANNISFVLHFHGVNVLSPYKPKHRVYNYLRTRILKYNDNKADAAIGVSEKVCLAIREQIRKDNVYCVYNGVNTDLFSAPERQANITNTVEILSVGNLIEIKGFTYLLEACRMLVQKKITNFHLNIIGNGTLRDSLIDERDRSGLQEYVTLLGELPYNTVSEYMKKSDIFVLPSFFEALGCVYLEAMASGCLTIGCRNQGIAEIIEHEKNGILVKEKDSFDLYEFLRKAIEDFSYRENISKQGSIDIRKYSWTNVAVSLKAAYEDIIRRKNSRRLMK